MEHFAVLKYNDLKLSEPLSRPLPRWGQACQNGQMLLGGVTGHPKGLLGLVLPTWPLRSFVCANMADRLPSDDHLLLDRVIVMLLQFPLWDVLFWTSNSISNSYHRPFFSDLLCASCFHLLERALIIALGLRYKDKMNEFNLSLPLLGLRRDAKQCKEWLKAGNK